LFVIPEGNPRFTPISKTVSEAESLQGTLRKSGSIKGTVSEPVLSEAEGCRKRFCQQCGFSR